MGDKILFSGIFADGIYKIEATLLLYTQFMQVCVWGAFLVEIRILQCSIGAWWKRSHSTVYPCNVTITTCSYATQFQTKKKPYLWLRHTKYLNSSNFYKFIYWHIWSNRLASFFMEYFVVCVVYSVLQPVFHSWFENFASWHYLCEWGCFGNRVSSEALLLLCVRNAPQFIRPMKKKTLWKA